MSIGTSFIRMGRPSRVEYYNGIILNHMMKVFIGSVKRKMKYSDYYDEFREKVRKGSKGSNAKPTIVKIEPGWQSYKMLYQTVKQNNPKFSHSTFAKCLKGLVGENILIKHWKSLYDQTFYSLSAKEWKYSARTWDYFLYPLNNSGTRWHYQVLRKGIEQYVCRINIRRRMTKEEQGQEQRRIFKQMLESPDYREQFSPEFREQFLSQHRHKENS